ncbi:MAG: glycosyltransferase [Pikeienuella sp.]
MPSIWSPLPPSKSGIANYVGALYLDQPEFEDCSFVVNDPKEIEHPCAADVSDQSTGDKHALLQIGNNIFHDYIYERAQVGGAIVEMHDLSLHHLHTEVTLARGDFTGYRNLLEECEGEWGRKFAYQRSKGYYSQHLEFHTRVNKRVTERAEAVIVHSEWARMQLELQGCRGPIYVIPHYALTPEQSPTGVKTRQEARARLGFADDDFIILSAGYVTRAKRIEWTVAAFEALADDCPHARLVIAGEVLPDILGGLITDSRHRDRIHITGYLADAAFCDYTLAADVLPVMRFPSAGESSGVASRALGFGRLVIAPELMAFSDLNDKYVEKIHLDQPPVEQLIKILRRWAGDLPALRRKEAEISAYAARHLSLDNIRKDVAQILRWHWN